MFHDYFLKNVPIITVGDQVRNKLDPIVEKADMILTMFPGKLKFTILLLDKVTDVRASWKQKYRTRTDYVAFYSRQNKTIYISVNEISLRILAHELAHAIIDQYYCTYNSCTLILENEHEVLAHLVELRIEF